MRRVFEWSENEIDGLFAAWGLVRILTEVDAHGVVMRELGFDATGGIAHRYPDEASKAERGVFDSATIDAPATCHIDPTEFDRFWLASDAHHRP